MLPTVCLSAALPSEPEQQAQRSSSPEVVLEFSLWAATVTKARVAVLTRVCFQEELVEEASSLVKEMHLEDVSAGNPRWDASVWDP